jgi:hypothetical protein
VYFRATANVGFTLLSIYYVNKKKRMRVGTKVISIGHKIHSIHKFHQSRKKRLHYGDMNIG